MNILKLIVYPDPILRQVAKPIDLAKGNGVFDWAPFAAELVMAMRAYAGQAIAAPQVGASIRMIAIDLNTTGRGSAVPLVMVNPVITNLGEVGEAMDGPEGCLSFPGVTVKVTRRLEVRVSYVAMDGEQVVDHVFKDLLARAIQHEVEHLDGRVLIDHIEGRIKRDMVLRKAKRAKTQGVRPKIPADMLKTPEGGR